MSIAEIFSPNIYHRNYEVTQMLEADLNAVVHIEESTGLSRWGYEAYRTELFTNPSAIMRVARYNGYLDNGQGVVGFVASRVTIDELHINNIATHPAYRRMRIALTLMEVAIEQSIIYGARRCILEVRLSNDSAQTLYKKMGFRTIGYRRDYYAMPMEDALVMQLLY